MPPPPRNYCLVDTQHENATKMAPLQCTLHDRIWILLEPGRQRVDWEEDLGSVKAHLRTSEGCVAIFSRGSVTPRRRDPSCLKTNRSIPSISRYSSD